MNVGMKELEQDTNVTIDCKILIFLTHDYKSMHLFILTDTDRCVVSNNAVFTPHMNVNPPLAVLFVMITDDL